MKFCYVDESGKGSEPVLVLAGVITDAHRMHVTKADWANILEGLSVDVQRPIDEFHSRHFYKGNGIWRSLDGEQRTAVLDRILKWLADRAHRVVFSAIDKKLLSALDRPPLLERHGDVRPWNLAALHLMLSIQKFHQSHERNKGHTVMVFDQGSSQQELAELALMPPEWTDSFYDYARVVGRRKKPNPEPPLGMIVDVPYFADSRHVGMLQVADLFSYLLRRHAELELGYVEPDYDEERSKISNWVGKIGALTVPDSFRWKASGGCPCNSLFRSIAPAPLIGLQKRSGTKANTCTSH